MLKSYLKIAWRNLLRHRMLSLINLTGLSISVAFCVLLFLHIRYEQRFDTFCANGDRLYRMEMSPIFEGAMQKPSTGFFSWLTRGDEQDNDLVFPLVVGPDLARTFPEVSQSIRFRDGIRVLVRVGGQVYKEENTVLADSGFFTAFSFPLLRGDARTVMGAPDQVVLSAGTAKKYFGDRDPMGQTIALVTDSTRLFKVAGVAADAPANSSIQYSVILPLVSDPDYAENVKERFNQMSHFLVVELRPGTDARAFEAKVNRWMKGYFLADVARGYSLKPEQVARFHWYLRPFADCHYNVSQPWGHYTDAKAIYELASIVVVILLLASLNYVLITVSNSAARWQEVGVRKVMGAGRRAIILQSWLETQLIVGMAVVAGVALAYAGVPLLRSVIGSGLTYDSISWSEVLTAALVLAVSLGVLAGYYPALLISSWKPVSIVKSFSTFKVNPRFSRVLVVVQFTCCVVLMMMAFVISRQMAFIGDKDLGFDKEQVLIIHNPTWDTDFSRQVRERLYAFARTRPEIVGYSSSTGDITGRNNTNGFLLNGEHHTMKQITVDYNYFSLLGIKLLQGREFSAAYPTDSTRAVRACVVNETLFRLLGPRARLGVYDSVLNQTIVGVVKDYNFESLTRKIEPELHRLVRGYSSEYLFRVRPGQMRAVIAAMGSEWRRVTNNYPFEYSFLDESIAQMYAADLRWQKATTISCFFAILIACMGLFGLAAINAVNRTREIGIRKVLGAGMGDLVALLSLGFLRLVFVSILLAVPLAWWMMNRWLEDFAFRIDIRWWMFVVVGATALTIALATVSLQVWRAALANPVDALRAE